MKLTHSIYCLNPSGGTGIPPQHVVTIIDEPEFGACCLALKLPTSGSCHEASAPHPIDRSRGATTANSSPRQASEAISSQVVDILSVGSSASGAASLPARQFLADLPLLRVLILTPPICLSEGYKRIVRNVADACAP